MILSSLRHKNIVKFIDFKETDLRILIIMEYLNGGSTSIPFIRFIVRSYVQKT